MVRPFVGTPVDYGDKRRWVALPGSPDKPVDVLYLYPSSCNDPLAGTICAIDNWSMVSGARRNLTHQAEAFAPVANVFSPLWRQVNAMKLAHMSFEEVDEAEWAEPRTDVFAALDYYFEHLNQGRPYFLAGHSQGSRLAYIVLSEYMAEHPDRYENMICAYCLGDALTSGFLERNPHVRAACSADDLGVVVSWNTEGPANAGHDSLVIAPGAISINPLNWRRDDTYAPAGLNLGTFMPRLLLPGLRRLRVNADAVCDLERGTVVVREPRLASCAITEIPGMGGLESLFGPQSYHGCDYSFFFLNIRENARVRAEAWAARGSAR